MGINFISKIPKWLLIFLSVIIVLTSINSFLLIKNFRHKANISTLKEKINFLEKIDKEYKRINELEENYKDLKELDKEYERLTGEKPKTLEPNLVYLERLERMEKEYERIKELEKNYERIFGEKPKTLELEPDLEYLNEQYRQLTGKDLIIPASPPKPSFWERVGFAILKPF